MTDLEREQLIEAWRVVMTLTDSAIERRIAWGRMAALIEERSGPQVERMERE